MKFDALKETVCKCNLELARSGLVPLTWGNVSGIDRRQGVVAIKPSGVPYEQLEPQSMVVVDLDGKVVEGTLKPSSDTATHLILYSSFEQIGGIAHSHSRHATMFAQARREIPCLGTTHADQFFGPVPVTRPMSENEVAADYEGNTGRIIVERFAGLDAMATPAVLVAGHGPFTWGCDAADAVRNMIALEAIAEMAIGTWWIDRQAAPLESYLVEKHHRRKHGPDAYYGQE
jgi:L-ribulose-5-phosphate 4-epimerase